MEQLLDFSQAAVRHSRRAALRDDLRAEPDGIGLPAFLQRRAPSRLSAELPLHARYSRAEIVAALGSGAAVKPQ